ncbi:hypothetical protein [Streptomyces rimosus]|uniref:hypothetical protein n=1 Tax=Streptomyces rimosus TaxID=1927 RepID=UPI0004C711FF|nr:hypothetical protein [Streptomyces rimosus]
MIEDILRGAQIRTPAYTPAQQAEDDRLLRERINAVVRRKELAVLMGASTWLGPDSPELAGLIIQGDAPAGEAVRSRARDDLTALCNLALRAPGATDRLTNFVVGDVRSTDYRGALVFGCLLYLGGHADTARFWWRYAAGAENTQAAYCLFLEGLVRGDLGEAVYCFRHYDAGAFLCEQDDESSLRGPDTRAEELETRLGDCVTEVDTRRQGAVLIPEKFLTELVG